MTWDYKFKFKINPDVPRFNLNFTAGYIGAVKMVGLPVMGNITQDQINAAVAAYINDHPGVLQGLTEEVKQALLQIAAKVVYIDGNGAQYYADLYDALYPPVELQSITAVYTQSGTVYTTDSLDSLKTDLVVTANYDDGTTADVTADCTLSGTLTAGTSTITATYGGKSDTFTVTVTASSLLYNWDFKTSLVDTVQGVTATLGNCSQSASGIAFNAGTDYITLGNVFGFDKTLEIDYESATASYGNVNGIWLWTDSGITNGFGHHQSSTPANNKYGYYTTEKGSWIYASNWGKTSFNGSATIKVTISSDGKVHVYRDADELNFGSVPYYNTESLASYLTIGSSKSAYPAFYNVNITAARIYDGVI